MFLRVVQLVLNARDYAAALTRQFTKRNPRKNGAFVLSGHHRTIWCRDDVVKELLHSLLGGFQKNCPQLFQDTWIFKILEKWS